MTYLSIESAYRHWGINNFEDFEISGERRFLSMLLPQFREAPLVVDVGANLGDYSALVSAIRPDCTVLAIEPNPTACAALRQRFLDGRIKVVECACAASDGETTLFTAAGDPTSPRSSTDQNWATQYQQTSATIAQIVKVRSLDSLLFERSIRMVDFLKIDVEGAELEVIRGCSELIARAAVKVVQFEFGEAHAYRRVFLRDFLELLPEFRFTRIATDRLIDLGEYRPKNWEVFCHQNIAAFNRKVMSMG